MGIGTSSGEKRAEEAARAAINSPLLEVSINGAKGVLFAIAGGDDLGMLEIQDAARIITESIDAHAKVIFGAIKDEKLKKNEVKVTVIATGFPETVNERGETVISSRSERPIEKEPDDAGVRGRIFNSMPTPRREEKIEEKPVEVSKREPAQSREPKPVDPVDEEDDDWGAVPAFLRRSKLK